jgi:D-alanyl-D-alanine dipeptidase
MGLVYRFLIASLLICMPSLSFLEAFSYTGPILSHSLVDLKDVDSSILIDLPYATNQNFTGKILYPEPVCFLHIDAAKALENAQRELVSHGYALKVWDGYRPVSLQAELNESVLEDRFLSPPKQSDRHARGTAVSVTLIDRDGFEVTMPTPFDIFTEKTTRDYPILTEDVLFHRTLLEQAMLRAGFIPNPRLWWHFDLERFETYPILDISLSTLLEERKKIKL